MKKETEVAESVPELAGGGGPPAGRDHSLSRHRASDRRHWLREDEQVEVTPQSIRLRKKILNASFR